MKNIPSLFGENIFTRAFQEFDEDTFFENLHNRVRNKSYFQKYKGFKTTLLWLSYLFNLASALTASYAIFWLVQWITGLAIVGYAIAGIFLFFLEKIKRKSSSEFWQVLFFHKEFAAGWFGLSLFCLALSLASSGFGVKEGTEQLSPDAELIASDSLATEYRAEIAKLEAENKEFKKQRNHEGVIYHRTQASIKSNKKMIADYQSRILEIDKKLEGKNEQLTTAYMEEVELTAWTLVWLTLLMELLFEACIAYVWYYYFRSYVERRKVQGITAGAESPIQATPPPSDREAELLELIQSLKSEISTLRTPISQNGTHTRPDAETSHTGLKNTFRQPIGFYSKVQRIEMEQTTKEAEKVSGQVWTDVDRDNSVGSDDKYTIEHRYTKGGKEKTVRYTMRMVNSRIGQYARELQEAIDKQLDKSVIENRRQWLEYWQGKRGVLLEKMETVSAS